MFHPDHYAFIFYNIMYMNLYVRSYLQELLHIELVHGSKNIDLLASYICWKALNS